MKKCISLSSKSRRKKIQETLGGGGGGGGANFWTFLSTSKTASPL